jgi:hypothetical protein
MKKSLLIFFISFALAGAHAQEKFSRWSIGTTAGPSFPTGHFAARGSDEKSGFASTGASAEVAGGYAFNRFLKLALVAGGQENHFSIFAQDPAPLVVSNAHHQNWKVIRILTGGVYTRPFTAKEKCCLQVRLLAGVLKTSVPGYSYDLAGIQGQSAPLHQSAPDHAMPWAFCYQADAGLKWKWSQRIFLVINAGYSGAQPTYTNTYLLGLSPNGFLYQKISQRMPVGSVHCRAGVEWDL